MWLGGVPAAAGLEVVGELYGKPAEPFVECRADGRARLAAW